MAKSWKSFVPQSENQQAEQELLNAENALQVSLEDFAKHDDALQKVLKEREDLEAKMQQMLNPQAADKTKEDPRFGSIITNIDEKRKADEKRFKQKRSLETKIAEKNKEIQAWEQKSKALKTKIDKTKTIFERQKKRIEDFQKKAKKLNDDFDYDKQRERITNKIDNFPFTEKKFKKKADDFPFKEQLNKPKEQLLRFKERLKNQPQVKKIKDQWEQGRELEREATTIKHQFEQKQNKIQDLKDKAQQLAKIDKIKEAISEKKIDTLVNQQKEKKEGEKKEEEKKKNLLERLKEKREDRKEKKIRKKEEEPKEKQKKNSLWDKRNEDKQKRKDELNVKENITQPTEKKSFLEKREERQQKRKDEQNAQNKEASKREQRQEERKNRKKDKFNY